MGTILIANCVQCGFEEEFPYGGGMMDFESVCNVPAISKNTGHFVVRNYFEEKLSGEFLFYNNPEMYSGKLGKDYHEWGEILLKRKNNICPHCKTFTMSFESFAFYD